ncbi:hypothetical protein ACMBCN_00445 [Candidatus Liberibacter asiaticus]
MFGQLLELYGSHPYLPLSASSSSSSSSSSAATTAHQLTRSLPFLVFCSFWIHIFFKKFVCVIL